MAFGSKAYEGQVKVLQFGCPAKVDVPEHAIDQLRLANRLWNSLVEIHQGHDEAKAALWSTRPEIAAIEEHLSRVDEAHEETAEAIRAGKSKGRSREAVSPEMRARARELSAERKALRADLRQAKSDAYDVLKPALEAARADSRAAVKATYATCCQEAGLYWATYNAVVAGFETSLKRVRARRVAGLPADVRFHRFDGTGTWSVQLQRQSGDPERTWATLVGGESKWRNIVSISTETLPDGDRRKHVRSVVTIRCGSVDGAPVHMSVPVTLHREVPPEADITQVQVTRRRVGTHYRLSVAFTLRLPADVPAERPGVVAVDLGWRSRGDGSLRVACWRGAGAAAPPSPLPEALRGWVYASDDWSSGEVVVPAAFVDEVERLRKIQSLRDDKLNVMKARLAEWLDHHPEAAEELGATGAEVRKWRSAARFAALVLRWRDARLDGEDEIFAVAEAWRRQDRHLLEWVANGTDQLAARRRDVYRVVAARLAEAYGQVAAEDMSIPQVLRNEHRAEESESRQSEIARSNSRTAAPGELRSALELAAGSRGSRYEEVPSAGTTRVHATCGTWLNQDASAQITMWCPVCETGFDQDDNACANLLRLATEGR